MVGTTSATPTSTTQQRGWLIAENSVDNPGDESMWSRFDWIYSGGTLYVCQTTDDRESDARATDAADSSDLTGAARTTWSE